MRTSATSAWALLLLTLLPVGRQAALAGSGGSLYSILGIGDIRYMPNVRGAGMGSTGFGLLGSDYINGMSPATWSRINRTRLEAGLLYEGFNSTDGNTSRYLARADFNGALLAVPISQPDGIVVVAGFTPYSNVNYDTYTSGTFSGSNDTLSYALHHVGTGSITKAQIGVSYAPFQTLSLGVSFDYLFGTLNSALTQIPTASTFAGGSSTEAASIGGVMGTLGVVYTGFGGIAEALRPLSLGIVFTSRGNLRTNRQLTYAFTSEHDTSSEVQGNLAIPIAYGVGLAYQAGDRYVLAADYYAQPWADAEINGSTPYGIRNSYRLGIGAERLPTKELLSPWLDRIAYRLGFQYHSTYYQLNGQPINEWAVTGGLAIPLSGETRLNIAAQYGGRGTTVNNLVKDRIVRLSVSLNISELWFTRFEEE